MATQNIDHYVENVRGTWVPSTELRQKVQVVDEGDGQQVVMDADQVVSFPDMTQIAQITSLSTPATFGASTNFVDFRLVKGNYGLITDLILCFTIANADGSNPITTVNPFFFLNYMEFWGNGGSEKIQTLYPEQMLNHLINYMTTDQQARIAKEMYINQVNWNSNINNLAAGGTITICYPLLGNFITQQSGIFFPGLTDDFFVRLYLRSNGVVSRTASVTADPVQIKALTLNILYTEVPSTVKKELQDEYSKKNLERSYLDTILYQFTGTFTAGTNISNQLTAFIGLCPYLLIGLRASNAAALDALNTYTQLGAYQQGASIEIDEPSGRNITGQLPWVPEFLQGVESAKFMPGNGTSTLPGQYILPFGDILAAESRVIKKGMINFSGQEYLNIKPGTTAGSETAEVWTFTPNQIIPGTATQSTAGSYQLTLFGQMTVPIADNAATTVVAAALNTILNNNFPWVPKGYNNQPIIATVTGSTFRAATTGVVVTLSNLPRNWASLPSAMAVNSMGLTDGTHALQAVAVLTTPGVPKTDGFTTGTYTLSVWARMFRHMHINKGKFQIYQSY